jgi:hypothetical protein
MLVTKPLINFFGVDNIIFVNNEINFKLENALQNFVIIWDEFKYEKNARNDLLKLLDEKNLLVSKKYQTTRLLENIPTIIIISNKYVDSAENDSIMIRIFSNFVQKIIFTKIDNTGNDNFNKNFEKFLEK